MAGLSYFILGFTFIRLFVALVNLMVRQWLLAGAPQKAPLVSILIPARNEEQNIGNLLKGLAEHDYSNLEIIIYDDLSTDKTFGIASSFAEKDKRFSVINGESLPEGWMGKNHGCYQLARRATGEFFLFLDADVIIGKGLIKNSLAAMEKNKLNLLSIFPKQIMKSFAEWLTVPNMNWILVSLLPLPLVWKSRRVSFSAANGQFMLFRADVYQREQFHQTLRNKNVEDIEISRLMKRKGYKIQTMLGTNQIQCRMYRTYNEAVRGFSRNVFYFFGNSIAIAFVFGLVTTFGFITFILTGLPILTLTYFIVLAALRIVISAASRQNILLNLLLAPIQQITFLYVLTRAAISLFTRSTQWKGRNISIVTS